MQSFEVRGVHQSALERSTDVKLIRRNYFIHFTLEIRLISSDERTQKCKKVKVSYRW